MKPLLPALMALLLIVATGVAHGLASHRWGGTDALRRAVARLDRLPTAFGDWEGQAGALGPRELLGAEAAGSAVRRFVNRRDGRSATVLVLCGRPGPIAVHTPDVCYAAAGYELEGDPARAAVPAAGGGAAATCWTAAFRKPGAVADDRLRILWAWSDGGAWAASPAPRRDYAGRPALYKLYVIGEARDDDGPGGGRAAGFLGEFLPALDRALFAGPGPGDDGPAGAPGAPRPSSAATIADTTQEGR